MSLNTYALAETADLKGYIDLQGAGENKLLENALNTASEIVEGYLRRQIVTRGALTEYHTFQTTESELLLLEWPILTVTNVYEDETRAYSTALSVNSDYLVSKPRGILIRIGGANSGLEPWEIGFRAIKIEYTAGYAIADVPWDIKDAVLWTAAHLYQESKRKGWDVNTQTDGLGTVTRFTLSRLPDYMKAQLANHRRPAVLGLTGERDT